MDEIAFGSNYYQSVIESYHYTDLGISEINFSLGGLSQEALRTKWICHHNAYEFAERLAQGEPSIVCTGIGLSGVPHLGTISQIIRATELQRGGIPVQLVLGDLDAYNGKNQTLQATQELQGKYASFITKIGFDMTPPSVLRDQYSALEVLRTSYLISKYMDHSMFQEAEEDLHEFYAQRGKVDSGMSYRRMQSLTLMTADFIHNITQCGTENVLVMLGIDEHKYILFAEKTLKHMQHAGTAPDSASLASMYSPIIKGLYGYPKMSKSFPESGISADLSPAEIIRRIMEGEGDTRLPEDNPVFQMICGTTPYGRKELEEVYYECANRTDKWNQIKQDYAVYLISLLSNWEQ